MQADFLIDAACAETGLADFGADTWREGFAVLLDSIARDAALNSAGEMAVGAQIKSLLVNRLKVEDWFVRHPEIAEEEIVAPLFGLGLPRTGSTAHGNLMALDPSRRYLRTWEASEPCPPPESATLDSDPRIAAAQARLDMQQQRFPEFSSMLPNSANGPAECMMLLALDFRSLVFFGMAHVTAYTDWVLEADLEPAYRYHRRVLQLLQWRCPPKRWWLRTPAHVLGIDALDRVYPDACFVMTHRDVPSVIASSIHLVHSMQSFLTTDPDRLGPLLAAHNIKQWDKALHRLITFRDSGNDARFFDIGFLEMRDAPMGAMERLYAWLGEELAPETERRMRQWWAENAQDRHGARQRDLTDYGLDRVVLDERFQFYTDRFSRWLQ